MTVAELIAELEKCPQNASVSLYIYDGECETSCQADYVMTTALGDVIVGYEIAEEEGFIPS